MPVDQRGNDALVGVALLALVVDDAGGPLRRVGTEARRIGGVEAVIVDGERDLRLDVARLEFARMIHPRVEVLPAVAGCGVHEAGAGVVGDMLAGDQGDGEGVAAA